MIRTSSGKEVDVFNFTKEMYDPNDVAVSLAKTCRYNGHTSTFYSVGLHSLNVKRVLSSLKANYPTQLYGLIHDATESYVGDVPGPIKRKLKEFNTLEKGVMDGICEYYAEKFNLVNWLSHVDLQLVKEVDTSMLIPEMAAQFKNTPVKLNVGTIWTIPANVIQISSNWVDDVTYFKSEHSDLMSLCKSYYKEFVQEIPQDMPL